MRSSAGIVRSVAKRLINLRPKPNDIRDGFGDRGDVAYVQPSGMYGEAPRLCLGDKLVGVGVRAYGRDDYSTGLSEQDTQFAPDSLRRVGDDDDASAKIEALRGADRRLACATRNRRNRF